MTDQSAGNIAPTTMDGAAFDAFRKRGRGGVLTKASVGLVIVMITIMAAFLLVYASSLAAVAAWYVDLFKEIGTTASSGTRDPSTAAALNPPMAIWALLPGIFILSFAIYLAMAAYEAACLRWLILGESGGIFFGMTLSADTWRVWLGYWLWVFGYVGCLYGIEFGALIVGFIVGLIVGAVTNAGVGVFAGFAVGVVFAIGAIGAYIWAVVRFAPAAAMSVTLKKFAFFSAWGVSKGRFWAMFWSFVLLFVIYFLLVMIVEAVGFGFMAVQLAPVITAGATDPQTIMPILMRPANIAALGVLYVILTAANFPFYLGMFGINARVILLAQQEGRMPAA